MMIRPVCRDVLLLGRKSAPATADDLPIAQDLVDTLKANAHACVGMAANMIGELKRIIAIGAGPTVLVMLNPVIVKKSGAYEAEEGCLSLDGVRKTTRYKSIEVTYQDTKLRTRRARYTDYVAQIIQHEIDHLEGILI